MADRLAAESRRLALAAALTREAARGGDGPADEEGLVAAARALTGTKHRDVVFDPAYPGVTAGTERAGERPRLVLACRARDAHGDLGTVFTTLIAGRRPAVSVAPPGTPIDPAWQPLDHL